MAATAFELRRQERARPGGVPFGEIQVERWDAPLVRLPDRDAVRDYLIARFVPPEVATDAAGRITTPATITKRGALIQARKAGSARGQDSPDRAPPPSAIRQGHGAVSTRT
jgi:hypothetical protein